MRVRGISINGRLTDTACSRMSYEDAKPFLSEYNANNSWILNFSSGNLNNNNKYNDNYVRPCTASVDFRAFLNSMFYAYEKCLIGKRSSPQAIEYMQSAYVDIWRLAEEAYTFSYKPSTSTCFMVTFPKLREVFAADFRDRVIHHWICLRLNPLFEERCIALGNVSHACRRKFGTKSAIKQVEEGICRVTCNMRREAWIYKGDIIGFFMNINKSVLFGFLKTLIENKYFGPDKDILLYLVEVTVFHSPEKDCYIKSPFELWKNISAGKSLFYNGEGIGEPIGNLTTQLFAGYYMSFLDEFVEKLFASKNYSYTRSVDDFVIICDDKVFLRDSIKKISDFTRNTLKIECHKDDIYFQPASHGVKFLGEVIKYHRSYTINRTVGRMINKVSECLLECKSGSMTLSRAKHWAMVLNSYFGFLSHTDSWKIRKKIMEMFTSDFYLYFYVVNSKVIKIKNKYAYECTRLCS
jgi:RNA-directed DNA polymerase